MYLLIYLNPSCTSRSDLTAYGHVRENYKAACPIHRLFLNELTIHRSSFLNTVMFPNLQMKRFKKQGLLPYRWLALAWKQLENCFEMAYVIHTPVQYHVTLHMFGQWRKLMLNTAFNTASKNVSCNSISLRIKLVMASWVLNRTCPRLISPTNPYMSE